MSQFQNYRIRFGLPLVTDEDHLLTKQLLHFFRSLRTYIARSGEEEFCFSANGTPCDVSTLKQAHKNKFNTFECSCSSGSDSCFFGQLDDFLAQINALQNGAFGIVIYTGDFGCFYSMAGCAQKKLLERESEGAHWTSFQDLSIHFTLPNTEWAKLLGCKADYHSVTDAFYTVPDEVPLFDSLFGEGFTCRNLGGENLQLMDCFDFPEGTDLYFYGDINSTFRNNTAAEFVQHFDEAAAVMKQRGGALCVSVYTDQDNDREKDFHTILMSETGFYILEFDSADNAIYNLHCYELTA